MSTSSPQPPQDLDPDAVRRVAALALSWMIAEAGGERGSVRHAATMLAALAGHEAAIMPAAEKSMRAIGMTPDELSAVGFAAQLTGEPLADAVLDAFFPPESREGAEVALLIGPLASWKRWEEVLSAWVRGVTTGGVIRPARGRRPAKEQSISAEYVDNLQGGARRYHRALIEQQRIADERVAHVMLDWTSDSLPPYRRPGYFKATPAGTDRSAPPLITVRRALKRLDREVHERTRTARGQQTALQYIRDRAILGVLVTLGVRVGSLKRMNVSSYLPAHRFPDGHIGPALIVELGAGEKGQDARRVKGIPMLLAAWIEEWIDAAGIRDELASALWISKKRSELAARRRLTLSTFDQLVIRALTPHLDTPKRYSPTTLRHLAAQLAELAGSDWITENREKLLVDLRPKGLPLSAVAFADILLDHAFNEVTDAYRDLHSETSRETWCRTVSEAVWELAWGDRGARCGPDRERRHAAAAAEQEAITRVDACRARVAALKQEKQELRAAALRRVSALAAHEQFAVQLELGSLADQIVDAAELLADARLTLEKATAARVVAFEARVPVDDAVADEDIWRDADDAPRLFTPEHQPEPRRDWVSTIEFLWCFGEGVMPPATFYRWLDGRLRHPAGDRRNLFDLNPDGTVKGLITLAPRNRRLHIPDLDLTRYPSEFRERLAFLLTFPAQTDYGKRRRS